MTQKRCNTRCKIGRNKRCKIGRNKRCKKLGAKMDAKLDVKKDGKKDAIDGVLQNCTIAPGLAPDCSPKLGKNYTKIRR